MGMIMPEYGRIYVSSLMWLLWLQKKKNYVYWLMLRLCSKKKKKKAMMMKRIFDLTPRKKRSSFSKKRKRYEGQNPNSYTAESEKTKKKDPSNPNCDTTESEKTKKENKSLDHPNCNSSSSSLKRKRCTAVKEKNKGVVKKANLLPRRTITETPEWVSSVIRRMNDDNPTLIFEKSLTSSDVKKSQGRLLISCQKLLQNDFLTHEESLAIKSGGVETKLFNQRSEKWDLCLKIWAMGNDIYALKKGWNDVVKANNLKKEDKISLWSFRCEGVLCFVLGTHTD